MPAGDAEDDVDVTPGEDVDVLADLRVERAELPSDALERGEWA